MWRSQRKKFFIDRKVQGAMVRRAVVYVLLVVAAISLVSALSVSITEGPMSGTALLTRMWAKFSLSFVASLLLIPIVAIDCIRLSNRFAGPMFRLRRAMKEAADGKTVRPIKLRDGDFWFDFAEDFNRYLALHDSVADPANAEEIGERAPTEIAFEQELSSANA